MVPGLYGYVSATKWLADLEVTRFDRATAYWTQRGWSPRGPIKTACRIDVPRSSAKLTPGQVTVAGVAWAQHRGIDRVEVQVDDGPWLPTRLSQEYSTDTWRQWVYDWDATAGPHTLRARATDHTGATQTADVASPVPDGATGFLPVSSGSAESSQGTVTTTLEVVTAAEKDVDQYWLSGAWNFRDLGGLRTTDGATVVTGMLFRSSHLGELDGEGQQRLGRLGVGTVFDLRGPREIERGGADKLPAAVRSVVRPFRRDHGDEDRSRLAPHEVARDQGDRQVTAATARAYMERAYREMPTLDGAAAAVLDVAHSLADGEQGVLFHCAAGKDRAGWTAISVLRRGRGDRRRRAHRLPAQQRRDRTAARLASCATYGDEFELSDEILGVVEDYYRIAMATVADRYGDFTGYLDAIGVDAAMRTRLRDRLLR